MLKERGVFPENISVLEDVKKVQRELDNDEKKILNKVKKGKK
jgi:DNA-damage-inducible protein D